MGFVLAASALSSYALLEAGALNGRGCLGGSRLAAPASMGGTAWRCWCARLASRTCTSASRHSFSFSSRACSCLRACSRALSSSARSRRPSCAAFFFSLTSSFSCTSFLRWATASSASAASSCFLVRRRSWSSALELESAHRALSLALSSCRRRSSSTWCRDCLSVAVICCCSWRLIFFCASRSCLVEAASACAASCSRAALRLSSRRYAHVAALSSACSLAISRPCSCTLFSISVIFSGPSASTLALSAAFCFLYVLSTRDTLSRSISARVTAFAASTRAGLGPEGARALGLGFFASAASSAWLNSCNCCLSLALASRSCASVAPDAGVATSVAAGASPSATRHLGVGRM
mmetsp:Transcript_46085/g.87928  ORF Transcript_46085/g.87928 Transcript_46085/m.87928 type:complete len:351 (+) Transcript_46085:1348-2400(+)